MKQLTRPRSKTKRATTIRSRSATRTRGRPVDQAVRAELQVIAERIGSPG